LHISAIAIRHIAWRSVGFCVGAFDHLLDLPLLSGIAFAPQCAAAAIQLQELFVSIFSSAL
jgi:hypothetical protein